MKVKSPGGHDGNPSLDFAHGPVHANGLVGSIERALEGRQTTPEGFLRRLRDDNVDPSGVVLDEGEGGEESRNGRVGAAEGSGENDYEEVGEEALSDEAANAAEV